MRGRLVEEAGHVPGDMRRGWGVSVDELITAALVALPFSTFLGIFVSQLVGLPSVALIVLTGILQGVGTFWIAGYRRRKDPELGSDHGTGA